MKNYTINLEHSLYNINLKIYTFNRQCLDVIYISIYKLIVYICALNCTLKSSFSNNFSFLCNC